MGLLTVKLVFAVLACCIGSGFQHGFNTGVVNNPQAVIEKWISATLQDRSDSTPDKSTVTLIWSITVSIYCLGGMVGGAITGVVVNSMGRKWSLILNNVFVLIGGSLMGLCKALSSFEVLIVGRFFVGVNSGLNAGIAPMYLTEISPMSLRGGIASIYQLVITISILLSQTASLNEALGTEAGWNHLLGWIIIAMAIIQVIMMFFCPESPKHLLMKGNDDKARVALEWYRGTTEIGEELSTLKAEMDTVKSLPSVKMKDFINDKALRRPLIISVMIMLAQQLSGINAVIFYSTKIFMSAKLSQSTATYATLGMGTVNVLITVASVVLVEIAGRKTLLIFGFAGLSGTTTLLTVSTIFAVNGSKIAGYICIVLVFIFIVFFASGAGSIPWFLVSELFNQSARSSAVSIAIFVNWAANTVVGLTFLPIEQLMGPYVFMIFVVLDIVFVVYILFRVPETRNRPIEEITALFK